MDRILQANRESPSLDEAREKARRTRQKNGDSALENDNLLFRARLGVPAEGDLKASLLDEIH